MAIKNYTPLDLDMVAGKKTPAVSLLKEAEPILSSPDRFQISEVVEHEPSEEIKSFVQPRTETITLPPDLKNIGLQPVSTPQFSSFQNIKLPISDTKIISGLHAPITSSLRWLATLAVYLLRKVHLTLKVVKGKAIRVFSK